MSIVRDLYRLQRIDLELDARRSRAREITALLEQDSVLREAEAQVASLQSALRPQEAHATDLNLEIQSVGEQSGELSSRLYSGKVSNPKELQDIQEKIAELKRRHTQLEDRLLETMINVEELQDALRAANTHLSQVQSERAGEQTALSEEQKQLRREIRALKQDRETVEQRISPDLQELYASLRAQKKGVAVAVLQGEMCSGCRVDQTTMLVQRVRRGQEIVRCASCGRILVAD